LPLERSLSAAGLESDSCKERCNKFPDFYLYFLESRDFFHYSSTMLRWLMSEVTVASD